MNSIAEYVKGDSFISFTEENGEQWEWRFEDGHLTGGPYTENDEYSEQYELKTFDKYQYVVLKDGTAMLTGCERTESQSSSLFGGFFSQMDNILNNSFVLPEQFDGIPVTAVSAGAFYWDRKLLGVALPDTVKFIGDGAFCGCWSLGGFIFPESCSYLGNQAFSSCKQIRELDFNTPIQRIGSNVFEFCGALERVSITDGFTAIPESMFFMCDHLSEINLPDSIKCIEKHAFAGCSALTSIELPLGLRRIEHSAFLGTGIKHISIPESVTYIGNDAFSAFKDNQAVPNSELTATVVAGSYAEQYCKENAIAIS